MSSRQLHLTSLLLWIVSTCCAQVEDVLHNPTDEIISYLNTQIDNNYDQEDIAQTIQEYLEQPLLLSKKNEHELYAFPFFTELQKQAIINHLNIYGGFISIEELQTLDSFDQNIVYLFPLLRVRNHEKAVDLNTKQKLTVGTSTINSSRNNTSNGTAYVLQYTYQNKKHWGAGLCLQQDAQDRFVPAVHYDWRSNNLMVDHYAFNLHYHKRGARLSKIIVGSYRLKIGQGLVFWNGFSIGKSSYTTLVERNAKVITPFQSTSEWDFLKGISIKTNLSRNIKSTAFTSLKNREGSLSFSNNTSYFSFDETGINTEEQPKEENRELIVGHYLQLITNNISIGNLVSHTTYYNDINPINFSYQQAHFHGKELTHVAIDHKIRLKQLSFFGEFSLLNFNSIASINGVSFLPNSKYQVVLSYRNFPAGYHSSYANPFRETSNPNNEKGLYVGLQINPNATWKINAFSDWYNIPLPSFGKHFPSFGNNHLIQATYTSPQQQQHTFRLETKVISPQIKNTPNHKWKIRYQNKILLNRKFELRHRIEHQFYRNNTPSGSLLFQDLIYKPTYRLNIISRVAVAFVNDHLATIFTQEHEVPLSYNYTQYSRNSWLIYLRLKYAFTRHLKLWLKTSFKYETATHHKKENHYIALKFRIVYEI